MLIKVKGLAIIPISPNPYIIVYIAFHIGPGMKGSILGEN